MPKSGNFFLGRLMDIRHMSGGMGTGTGTMPVYGYGCNVGNLWCYAGGVYLGRLVDFAGGLPVYAIASICCEYPLDLPMSFVHADIFPPTGVSFHIDAIISSVANCPNLCGRKTRLKYDPNLDLSGGDASILIGGWHGDDGLMVYDIRIQQVINPPPAPPSYFFQGRVSGYCGTGGALIGLSGWQALTAGCSGLYVHPFRATQPPAPGQTCCTCPSAQIDVVYRGFCKRRHIGRLVDYKKARIGRHKTGTGTGTFSWQIVTMIGTGTLYPVYAIGDLCCPPDCAANCCSVYAQCTLHISLTSGCAPWNQVVTLPPDPVSGWTGTFNWGTPSKPMKVHVDCETSADGKEVWFVATYSTSITGCDCLGTSPPSAKISNVGANCIPLDVNIPAATVTCAGFSCDPCLGSNTISGVLTL
jgi:hypothetical protein